MAMKKSICFSGLVVILIALTAAGCKKEKSEPFIGKWEIQTTMIDTVINNVVIGDSVINWDPGELWIEYRTNNTGHISIGIPSEFTWSLDADILILLFTGQDPLYLEYVITEPHMSWTVTTSSGTGKPNPGDVWKIVRHDSAVRMTQ